MEKRIRVCFLCFEFSPSIGGAQARAEKQARHLQALGHDVTIVTLRHARKWKRTETLDGLSVVRVSGIYRRGGQLRMGRLGHFPVDIAMLLMLLRLSRSYDVIHVFQISPLAAVAALVGKLTQKPVVISIQCIGPSEAQRIQLERGAAPMTDTLTWLSCSKIEAKDLVTDDITYLSHVALGSSFIVNYLRKSNALYQVLSTRGESYLTSRGFRAGQIVHIPGSVDIQKFRPTTQQRRDPPGPERDIICVARLDYQKGIDVLLHAWGRMMQMPTGWRANLKPRLLLVGEGKFKPQLERIVAELGIAQSVEFLGARTDVADLLQQAWGFALSSRWEGMPNALLEAMACGLPCVATSVSGSEDLITNGINGLLVEPEQPAELALALRSLIDDTDLAQRLGREAYATVVRNYQLSSVVEQCLQLYRRLLSAGKNGDDGARQPERMPLHAGNSLQGGVQSE